MRQAALFFSLQLNSDLPSSCGTAEVAYFWSVQKWECAFGYNLSRFPGSFLEDENDSAVNVGSLHEAFSQDHDDMGGDSMRWSFFIFIPPNPWGVLQETFAEALVENTAGDTFNQLEEFDWTYLDTLSDVESISLVLSATWDSFTRPRNCSWLHPRPIRHSQAFETRVYSRVSKHQRQRENSWLVMKCSLKPDVIWHHKKQRKGWDR